MANLFQKILLNFKYFNDAKGSAKESSLLGIDIRQNFIRVVELAFIGKQLRYRLASCVNIALEESFCDESLVTTLKQALRQKEVKTKYAAVALPHDVIAFKELQVVVGLSSKEMQEFLRFNFQEHIGEVGEAINFDYQVTEKHSDSNMLKIEAIAVKNKHITRWLKLLRAADLSPKIIDIDAYALERALRWQLPDMREHTIAINIEHGQVLVIVLGKERLLYMHSATYGHKPSSTEQMLDLIDEIMLQTQAALRQHLHHLVLGGEMVTAVLATAASNRFNIRVDVARPLLNMEVSDYLSREEIEHLAPLMMIGVGLALRIGDIF